MKTLLIFDPALCCNSGVCGVDVDEALVAFAADVNWYQQQGGQVTRFNLSQQPMAFVEQKVVNDFLQREGEQALPLILLDDKEVLSGRYPTRQELADWNGVQVVAQSATPEAPTQSCCKGSGCC